MIESASALGLKLMGLFAFIKVIGIAVVVALLITVAFAKIGLILAGRNGN